MNTHVYKLIHTYKQEKEALEKEAALKFREAWGDHMPPPAPKIEEAFAEATGGKISKYLCPVWMCARACVC
jgi:hypothetical protein